MKKHEQDILEEMYGVTHIENPDERREAARIKYESMSKIQQLDFDTRLGMKLAEADAKNPGDKYALPNWTLVVTILFFCFLSVSALFFVVTTHVWIALKIVAGVLGVVWFFTAVRGMARIIYRLANNKDF